LQKTIKHDDCNASALTYSAALCCSAALRVLLLLLVSWPVLACAWAAGDETTRFLLKFLISGLAFPSSVRFGVVLLLMAVLICRFDFQEKPGTSVENGSISI
jgi:hypothetical protein